MLGIGSAWSRQRLSIIFCAVLRIKTCFVMQDVSPDAPDTSVSDLSICRCVSDALQGWLDASWWSTVLRQPQFVPLVSVPDLRILILETLFKSTGICPYKH